ncbi:class I SAM-dependent methyltransferase [Dissulfurimicrobium hydrothermale]|uniref:class I SAM-dependent methyltransferase n=1 Tax=Dissulfurimicrobium hydrothermale TaxID=1750598 RepID=UPI001EDA4CBC|nr:class I SAM-dependent methyltransferase [Dissulfurimicrobium hydrothermale]UKL13849.1 class I SAM-dependent methyltransferase [Dissulfurimicrobium hydrothermale]
MNNQKKNGDLIKISGDYHYKASLSKNKIKKFWYYSKKTAIKRFLPPQTGDNVLDVGCGSGVITNFLSELGASAIGIDGNIEAINFAKSKFENSRCRFIYGLVDDDYKFDLLFNKIYCLELIEHIYYNQGLKMLRNFYRILKPGGKVFLTTPNYRSAWPLIEYLMDKFHLSNPLDKYQHVEHYDRNKLKKIIEEAGFQVNHIKTNCLIAPWLAPFTWGGALMVDNLESKLPYGGSILVAVFEKESK